MIAPRWRGPLVRVRDPFVGTRTRYGLAVMQRPNLRLSNELWSRQREVGLLGGAQTEDARERVGEQREELVGYGGHVDLRPLKWVEQSKSELADCDAHFVIVTYNDDLLFEQRCVEYTHEITGLQSLE